MDGNDGKTIKAIDQNLRDLLDLIETNCKKQTFVKLVLSKKRNKSDNFRKINIIPFLQDSNYLLSVTRLSDTQSFTNNMGWEECLSDLSKILTEEFFECNFWTTEEHVSFRSSKKGKTWLNHKVIKEKVEVELEHNRKKNKVVPNSELLFRLGISNKNGTTRTGQKSKLNQIRRFIEIVLQNIDKHQVLSTKPTMKIADMASGSAYLSMLLFQYLQEERNLEVELKGVERRPDLVKKTNALVNDMHWSNIVFEQDDIINSDISDLDILLALHACDTATDEAIYKGIMANTELIFCSPCCHKELRPAIVPEESLKDLFKYGKHEDKLAEIITDTLRVMYLNKYGYDTKIIEFVSSEHSGKNSLIVASKKKTKVDKEKIQGKIERLKNTFGIEGFSLEYLLTAS